MILATAYQEQLQFLCDSSTANFVKPFFSHFVKGIKIKINAKFRASRRLRFEDTKIQRKLCHPKFARKVSGLSRNGPLLATMKDATKEGDHIECQKEENEFVTAEEERKSWEIN